MPEGKGAESYHNMGKSMSKKSVDRFVNPGTPAQALVSEGDMEQAQVSPTATNKLRAAMGGSNNK